MPIFRYISSILNDPEYRPEKLAATGLVLSLLLTLFAAVFGIGWAHSHVIQATVIPLAFATLFGVMALWRSVLIRREREESVP